MNPVCLSSDKHDWETPDEVFDPLHEEFNFRVDVCATQATRKTTFFFGPDNLLPYNRDGLVRSWEEQVCWMNPPYGRELKKWVQKAWNEAGQGATVVCLVPARTDTNWWGIFWDHKKSAPRHDKDEVRFIKGRIKFKGAPNSAPFPSAIVVLRSRIL